MVSVREKRNVCKILVGKPKEMRPQERGLDGKIKLKETKIKKMGRSWTEFVSLRAGLYCRLL